MHLRRYGSSASPLAPAPWFCTLVNTGKHITGAAHAASTAKRAGLLAPPATLYFGIALSQPRRYMRCSCRACWAHWVTSTASTGRAPESFGRVRSPPVLLCLGDTKGGPKSCYLFCAHWTPLLSSVSWFLRDVFYALVLCPPYRYQNQAPVHAPCTVDFVGKRLLWPQSRPRRQ